PAVAAIAARSRRAARLAATVRRSRVWKDAPWPDAAPPPPGRRDGSSVVALQCAVWPGARVRQYAALELDVLSWPGRPGPRGGPSPAGPRAPQGAPWPPVVPPGGLPLPGRHRHRRQTF